MEKGDWVSDRERIDLIPMTASSATLACCFTKSSLAWMFRSASDSFSDRVFTVSLNSSSLGAAFDVTSVDGGIWFASVCYNNQTSSRNSVTLLPIIKGFLPSLCLFTFYSFEGGRFNEERMLFVR